MICRKYNKLIMYSRAFPNTNCRPREIAIAATEPNLTPFPVFSDAAFASIYIYIYISLPLSI